MPSVRLDSKGTVGTMIQWNSSSTDTVYNGNRRPLNSRHTAVCHLQRHSYMYRDTHVAYNAFRTTVPGVLADSMLRCFLLRVVHDDVHIQQYLSVSFQSCNASKQLLQGEKQKQFYIRGNFIAFYFLLFCNPYCFFNIPCEIILFNFASSHYNLLITVYNWRIFANYFGKSNRYRVCQNVWRK